MAFRISRGDPDYGRSRSPRFRAPTRGVRVEATADDWWDDLLAVRLVLPDDATFSHTTAAHIAGLPLPTLEPRPFHVTVPQKRGSRQAVAWHERDLTGCVEQYRGLPITTPLRTWFDLGSMLSRCDLVIAADHLLHRRMVQPADLSDVPRTPGADLLRAAARLADGRTRSPRESLLRMEMHDRAFPRPELNMDIVEEGGWIGEGDFVWPQYRTIADYDGDHHRDEKQHTQDNETRDLYAEYGWRHVAITKRMLRNMNAAMERIARALRSRGWRPG